VEQLLGTLEEVLGRFASHRWVDLEFNANKSLRKRDEIVYRRKALKRTSMEEGRPEFSRSDCQLRSHDQAGPYEPYLTTVCRIHVRHIFSLVRPRTGDWKTSLDQTIKISVCFNANVGPKSEKFWHLFTELGNCVK